MERELYQANDEPLGFAVLKRDKESLEKRVIVYSIIGTRHNTIWVVRVWLRVGRNKK